MTIFGIPEELLEAIAPTNDEPPEGALLEAWLLGELEWTLECLHNLCFDDLCDWRDRRRFEETRRRVKRLREKGKAA